MRPTSGRVRGVSRLALPLADPRKVLEAVPSAGIVVGAALAIFWAVFARDVSTDLPLHTVMTGDALRTSKWPGNFLFYGLNALFAGFSQDQRSLRAAAAVLLALAVGAKYILSWQLVQSEVSRAGRQTSKLVLTAALIPLMFVFSIPTRSVYLGQFTPTVWHNSTTILLVPFAISMFASGLAFARTGDRRWLVAAGVAGALAIATKPTFSMAYGAALPLFVLLERRRPSAVAAAVGLAFGLAALVLAQYAYIYHSEASASAAGSGVALRPLHVWRFYSQDIWLSLLASFLFPLVGLATLRRDLLAYDGFRLAALLTLVSILMFVLLGETGPREYDGNFIWQTYVSVYLLFVTVVIIGVVHWRAHRAKLHASLLIAAFAAHCASGAWFLYYMFDRGQVV